MSTRHSVIAACGAVLALSVAVASLRAESLLNRLEYLTFGMHVALPGVTLAPGSYVFEIANPDSGDIVRVRNRNSNRVAFSGFTHRIERPAGRRGSVVVLGEARKGEAAPIIAWYPIDSDAGYQFIYR